MAYKTTRLRRYWIVYEELEPGLWLWRAEFRYKQDALHWAKSLAGLRFKIEIGEVI